MPYKVVRIRGSGRRILLSEHLHLTDAQLKASKVRGIVTDAQGKIIRDTS